jgi:5-aminopentanamidase
MSNPTLPGRTLRVAAAQFAAVNCDVAANLKTMRRVSRDAAQQGVQVLVFPELFACGYEAGPEFERLADPHDGSSFREISALAREFKIAICYGYAERDGAQIFNAAQFIGADGQSLIKHRKSHLYGAYEREWFSAGDSVKSMADYLGFRLSALICYEIEFPELARSNAKLGANLFLVPTAVMGKTNPDNAAQLLARARAAENNAFVIYSNLTGETKGEGFNGESLIAGPFGRVLAAASGSAEQLIVADATLDQIAEAVSVSPYLGDLRRDVDW